MSAHSQHQQHRPRLFSRISRGAATLSVLGLVAVGGGATSEPTPADVHPVGIEVKVDRGGKLRASTRRAISIPVWMRCDVATVGEIDAALEMRVPGRVQPVRAVRNVAVSCDESMQRTVLVFESRDGFTTGFAKVRLDASAGFSEEFNVKHIGPIAVQIR